MRVRVDATWHHIAAGGVEHLVATHIGTNANDLAVLEQYVGRPSSVSGNDSSILDNFGHCCSSRQSQFWTSERHSLERRIRLEWSRMRRTSSTLISRRTLRNPVSSIYEA